MSLIVKGFGSRGATILVKGFTRGIYDYASKKVLYAVSLITRVLNVESRKF